VIKYLNDYAESFDIQDSDIIKCISVLQEYADQQVNEDVDISSSKHSLFVEINGEMKQYYSSKCIQDNFKPKQIDWDEIESQFFNECTDYVGGLKKFNTGPHNIFEWFKSKLT